MSKKYLYFAPTGGFVDILSRIRACLRYCANNNRILLIDTTRLLYKINFCEYFDIHEPNVTVITDSKKINQIIGNPSFTTFPVNFDFKTFVDNQYIFLTEGENRCFKLKHDDKKTIMPLPSHDGSSPIGHKCESDIIVYIGDGGQVIQALGGLTKIKFQKDFADKIKQEYLKKKSKLGEHYLCIHTRHTDYQSDYELLYNENKHKIHSYQNIYLCTDNESVINYFRSKKLNVYNFTTFPNQNNHINNVRFYENKNPIAIPIHFSDINGETQLIDLLIDISFASDSTEFLSNSVGGFTNLCRYFKLQNFNIIDYLSRIDF